MIGKKKGQDKLGPNRKMMEFIKIVEHPLSTIRLYREKLIREKFSIERETLARLHFDEGLTNKELAKRFNVSESSIKQRLYGMDRTGNKVMSTQKDLE